MPAPTLAVVSVDNLEQIKIQTPDAGIVIAGGIRSVLLNYPTLAAALKTALKDHLAGLDNLAAAKRWKELSTKGIALPAPVVTAINARLEALRAQRETALRALLTNTPLPGTAPVDPKPTPPTPPGADATPEEIAAYQQALQDVQAIIQAYQQALSLWNAKKAARQAAVARVKSKMDELVAAGIAITAATQTIVNAAQPPPVTPPPPPPPPPDDGL